MEKYFFNSNFSEKPKVPQTEDLENSEEQIESEKEINEEIEKLGDNINGLQEEIREFGDVDELKEAFRDNPKVAARIIERVKFLSPIFVMLNVLFVGSLNEAIHSTNYEELAIILFKIAVESVVISGAYEGLKQLIKKSNKAVTQS